MSKQPEELKDASLDKAIGGMGDTGTHEVGAGRAAKPANSVVQPDKPRNTETASKIH